MLINNKCNNKENRFLFRELIGEPILKLLWFYVPTFISYYIKRLLIHSVLQKTSCFRFIKKLEYQSESQHRWSNTSVTARRGVVQHREIRFFTDINFAMGEEGSGHLQVAVDDPPGVEVLQRAGGLQRQRAGGAGADAGAAAAVLAQHRVQRPLTGG